MKNEEVDTLRMMCKDALAARNLQNCPIHTKRLKWEIAEIKAQDEAAYFIDLHARGVKYPKNENNLLVAWLLGICDDYEIEKDPECNYGEFPDIDVDYLKVVRDYLKNEWALKEFDGQGFHTCSIGNYNTFGIKQGFIECAVTYGEDRHEINAITKQLKLKDDEGKGLTFDKALELYPELKAYSEKYPHIARAVKKMLHRNKNMGKHAGGLIIADSPIDNLVPLVKNAKDGSISSAWVEGLHGQDLGPVGLIKFDMLVIADLERIAMINRIIKKRHGLQGVCAKPETPDWDWSDGSYRHDPKTLELANKADLLGIFQFDSDGIRKLVREGGVTNFRDIVAYSAIYRPGPLNMKMDKAYTERKHGREEYTVHQLLEKYLGYTYGVMCFQEQVMQMLHFAGNIPLKDTYAVVKAIAKKKVKGFAKYKEKFMKNAAVNLGLTEEQVVHLWGQIESFAEYGFNRSHSCAYSYISARLLYQKANYPLEFWAGTLACEEDTDTLNLYRRQAQRAGVSPNYIDLNKSHHTFSICDEDNQIYMGFGNIKGVGEAAARKIVEVREAGGPFKGIEDFMLRYGTDAKVLRALIGLRLFKESDPVTLAKFVENYKEYITKQRQRHQRYKDSMERYDAKIKELVPTNLHPFIYRDGFLDSVQKKLDKDLEKEVEIEEEYETGETQEIEKVVRVPKNDNSEAYEAGEDILVYEAGEGDQDYEDVEAYTEVVEKVTVPVMATRIIKKLKKYNPYKQLKKEFQLRARTMSQYVERNEEEAKNTPSLATFNSSSVTIDPKYVALLRSRLQSEVTYLGFEWQTEMERSPDFNPDTPHTYDDAEILASQGKSTVMLDGQIMEVQSKLAKNKRTKYHSLVLIDALGRRGYINVWSDDWERCKDILKKGNLVRLVVRQPTKGFSSYSLWSPRDRRSGLGGVVQAVRLMKAEEETLSEDDFEKKMTELTGETDE
jgi:DNA polymerase III alpha subunit